MVVSTGVVGTVELDGAGHVPFSQPGLIDVADRKVWGRCQADVTSECGRTFLLTFSVRHINILVSVYLLATESYGLVAFS